MKLLKFINIKANIVLKMNVYTKYCHKQLFAWNK